MKKAILFLLPIALLAGLAWTLLVAVPQQATVVEQLPLDSSPADVGLAYEDFTISPADSDLILRGWWMPADTPQQRAHATLVFIHGGGSHRNSSFFMSLDFYRAMVDTGINVVAIDLRNHGESGAHTDGLQFGRTEQHDARAAIDWARRKVPGLPVFAMGISMGGATIIHAASEGAALSGLVLLDPLLDTADVFARGGWIQSGLPPALFAPSAWAAMRFHGFPGGEQQALDRAAALKLPILLLQDPDDPVTRLPISEDLAQRNDNVSLWIAPPIDPDDERLAFKGRWGSHVAAFQFFPAQTVGQISTFIERVTAAAAPPAR